MIKNDYMSFAGGLVPPEELKSETLAKMKGLSSGKRRAPRRAARAFAVVAASLMSAAAVSVTAYAVSPELQEFVSQVIGTVFIDPEKIQYAQPIPQQPADGFALISEAGEKLPEKYLKSQTDEFFPEGSAYALTAELRGESGYCAEKIAYSNGEVIVLRSEGFSFAENERAVIGIALDLSPEYCTERERGELVEIGYICGGYAVPIYGGRTDGESLNVDFTAPADGEYEFYFINCCAGLQNCKSLTVTKTS